MTILELENLTGLDRATIRFYEKEGLITPSRKENSYRDYSVSDSQEILKIKLLRQLDVSIEMIRNLQQGSADISSVLRVQASMLEEKIADTERAAAICKEISSTDITYSNLDATLYLNRLTKQSEVAQPQQEPATSVPQQEQHHRYVEYHPVRRFVARMVDYSLLQTIVRFVLVVILRIRPFGDFLSTVVTYTSLLASVPLQAWMLRTFATTPGKWAMGIQVLSYKGEKLSFSEALEREWVALWYGYGCGIPIYSLWRLFKSYKTYTNREPLEQDAFVEHLYSRKKFINRAVFAVICAILIFLSSIITLDFVKPKYRGNDLTVAQFAENFNFYAEILDKDFSMNPDGTWYDPQSQNGGYVVIVIDKADKPNEPFRFETKGEGITRIAYNNSWQDISIVSPLGDKMITAMVTAIMSQGDIHVMQLKDILYELNDYTDQNSADVTFNNIQIRWTIKSENCSNYKGTFYTIDKEQPSRLEFDLEIIINQE